MAHEKILEISEKLQNTNAELQLQARELEIQADELTEQNSLLEIQKKQLDETSRLKTNFLSNMSHELRTPLNSVIALSGVLSRELANKISEDEYSYLEIIERNGKNLLDLINDILDISRIESGREEIEITKFNPMIIVTEVISMLMPQANQKNVELLNLMVDTELSITSDSDKLRHILQNIIGNAVKFTDKGHVTVSSRMNDASIEITVTDTGIGITEEHIPYIFDEFRQADGSTSRRFGGTGLGLAISRKYANLLGGTITVNSIPNKGSEFTVILPLHYAPENPDSAVVETHFPKDEMKQTKLLDPPTKDSTKKLILLVEDNEAAVIQIKDMVTDMGYGVMVAPDAEEALVKINQAVPDAIILDLTLPGIDGFKMLEILRNTNATAQVPVLILTAKHITKEELKFLKRNNIHQLIQKGDVRYSELKDAVRSMLYPTAKDKDNPKREIQDIERKPVVQVVEDNPDNMVTVNALLADHHIVLEASNAREGVAMAAENIPDLILLDIELPDMNGIEVFKQIRGNYQLQHIPIIALTASVMTHDRETIMAHGFDAFIAKPIIAQEFFKVIKELLYGK